MHFSTFSKKDRRLSFSPSSVSILLSVRFKCHGGKCGVFSILITSYDVSPVHVPDVG